MLEPYCESFSEEWDDVVRNSRNGTFILQRPYMDYHSDRFEDESIIVKNANGKIVALMAAAVPRTGKRSEVTAHPGLTYGGLILPPATIATEVMPIMSEIAAYYRDRGFASLRYRAIPHIYHRYPCEEDIYALIQMGARVDECLLSSTYTTSTDCAPAKKRDTRQNISKAGRSGLTYRLCDSVEDWETFFSILSDTLECRHNAHPVHTLPELRMLAGRFPDNICLWMTYAGDGEALGGIVMYLTDTCAHTQYTAATPRGFRTWALPGLINHLIEYYSPNYRYFDFGTSNEDHGRILNEGLIRQKAGFGSRGTAAMTFLLDLK